MQASTDKVSNNRFCVFCGRVPLDKNKEHVLPYWLLEMTGDPSRVVKLGTNFEKQQDIRFSWSSLVMPSCEPCNRSYSELEGNVKPIVESLARRDTLPAGAYLTLLDWLDKVRIGLWLAYHVLQGNPTGIEPTFHIASRVGTKDRFVGVYPIESKNRGLNAHGVESLLFHRTPCCFGLRVNDVFLLNASADFLFAGRCGFPSPRVRELRLDGPNAGLSLLGDFKTTRRVKHPLMRRPLHKPSVLLYQPIMQRNAESGEVAGYDGAFDAFLSENTLPPYMSGKGVLFRQYSDRVAVITDMTEEMEFDTITGHESRPMYDLTAQVYELQSDIQDLWEPAADDPKELANYRKLIKTCHELNRRISNYLRSHPPLNRDAWT